MTQHAKSLIKSTEVIGDIDVGVEHGDDFMKAFHNKRAERVNVGAYRTSRKRYEVQTRRLSQPFGELLLPVHMFGVVSG